MLETINILYNKDPEVVMTTSTKYEIKSTETILDLVNTLRANSGYPYLPIIEQHIGHHIFTKNNDKALMLGSCDYLGLSQDQRVKEASIRAIESFGTNTYGAQLFCGYTKIHHELEATIAGFFKKEDAILFPSGFSANLGTISLIVEQGDVVINDQYNHTSIYYGGMLSKAEIRTFAHNKMGFLESILKTSSNRKKLIVVDGLFSADGDLSPLKDICSIAKKYNAMVMVDEAHSTGAIGPTGRGASEHFDILDQVDIIMGTMSKSIGSTGGFIAGEKSLIDLIRNASPFYQNSRGLAPAIVASALESFKIIKEEGHTLRKNLTENVQFFQENLRTNGFDILNSTTHVIPIIIGDASTTLQVSQWLMENGLFAVGMVPPAVPSGKARLRLGITSRLSKDECAFACELLCSAKKRFGF